MKLNKRWSHKSITILYIACHITTTSMLGDIPLGIYSRNIHTAAPHHFSKEISILGGQHRFSCPKSSMMYQQLTKVNVYELVINLIQYDVTHRVLPPNSHTSRRLDVITVSATHNSSLNVDAPYILCWSIMHTLAFSGYDHANSLIVLSAPLVSSQGCVGWNWQSIALRPLVALCPLRTLTGTISGFCIKSLQRPERAHIYLSSGTMKNKACCRCCNWHYWPKERK